MNDWMAIHSVFFSILDHSELVISAMIFPHCFRVKSLEDEERQRKKGIKRVYR